MDHRKSTPAFAEHSSRLSRPDRARLASVSTNLRGNALLFVRCRRALVSSKNDALQARRNKRSAKTCIGARSGRSRLLVFRQASLAAAAAGRRRQAQLPRLETVSPHHDSCSSMPQPCSRRRWSAMASPAASRVLLTNAWCCVRYRLVSGSRGNAKSAEEERQRR